ncbi:response regulator transcription factor [Streptomyces sp. AB3(2024)]|uniref:helix-turn-helix transcriptional regulator n=1 Tax=Streptomyces sp. AB3(2024) TaxID=3317321 RepID=UPI0035A2F816
MGQGAAEHVAGAARRTQVTLVPGGPQDPAERFEGLGPQVRALQERFDGERQIVVDGELGFLPSRSGGALLIREPDLLGYLLDVFQRDWEYAAPFATGPQAAHDISETVKQSILALLAKGLKDDSIARRLGISLRTWRRHVSELLLGLGAHSRFQAGVIAERQGLTETRRPSPEQGAPAAVPGTGTGTGTAPQPQPQPAVARGAEAVVAGVDGPSRCPGCGVGLPAAGGRRPAPGRPARHCSGACRARAYRARRKPAAGDAGSAAGA